MPPHHMRAVSYSTYVERGESKAVCGALEFVDDAAVPVLPEDFVLVKVHASSMNPIDWKTAKGFLSLVRSLPITPGMDVAGTVVSIGTTVTKFQVGDPVYGMQHFKYAGGMAEYATLRESHCCHIPPHLTYQEAAAVPLVFLTAYQGLRKKANMQAGAKVLVLGGSGGVGTTVIQLAKALSASHIATTCSPANAPVCQSLGADQIIDYHTEEWWNVLSGQNYDVIFDTVGGAEHWPNAAKVLAPKTGAFVTIAADEGKKITVGSALSTGGKAIGRKFMSLFGQPNFYLVMAEPNAEDLEQATTLVFKPHIQRVFAFEEVKEMFAASMAGHTVGKLVLAVDDKASTQPALRV